jgi:hypothetical protein
LAAIGIRWGAKERKKVKREYASGRGVGEKGAAEKRDVKRAVEGYSKTAGSRDRGGGLGVGRFEVPECQGNTKSACQTVQP